MRKGLAAIGVTLAAALAAAAPAAATGTKPHVQQVALTFLAGDRVLDANIALAPGVPARITITNYTREFHTFTVPGLKLSELVRPAHGTTPSRTSFTFTAREWGTFAWHCLICPSGAHGKAHSMDGEVYVIVSPDVAP